ncbi:MAG: TonB-dependent receptor [Tannerellaceae bacterium]|jgi:outer membrane receptor for ferrienterochelin and colicin|nr:TonB-dependent receptor [Tannerellaceae bacterium]
MSKRIIFILCIAFMGCTHRASAQDKRIDIGAGEITVADAFRKIESLAGYSIAYSQSDIDTGKTIHLPPGGVTLDQVMNEILKPTNLTWKLNGYHIVLQLKDQQRGQATSERQSFTVSGRITDATTGEVLIGATVAERRQNRGTSANTYGFYSLTLPKGEVLLNWSYLGYDAAEAAFEHMRDTVINIALDPFVSELAEVVVSAGDNNIKSARPGQIFVPVSTIRNKPALMGENDLMKSLQYIPGVQSSTEGKADLSVRGGTPDQNLILLDGNPIYNANHLFGFMSVFNTDALKNVTLYKSGFPARFGGRLSSVIDANTKDGNKERFGGSATLGLLAAKFNIEGPILKDRTSFTLSGRRSWADTFMSSLQKSESTVTTVYFYDINAKLHHKISDRTSLYLTAYNGHDKLKNTEQNITVYPGQVAEHNSTSEQSWRWGNTIVAARLNSSLSGNLFMNANLSYNGYRYNTSIENSYTAPNDEGKQEQVSNRIGYDSGISDYTGTLEFEYIPAPAHYVRSGVQYVYHNFRPEVQSLSGSGAVNINNGKVPAGELSAYVEDEWEVVRQLKVNGGVRFSMFSVRGKTYAGVDPRLSARYMFSDRVSVKAGYTQMQQYIHLLSNNSLLFQTDLWVPATDRIAPMNSTQYSLGLYVAFPKLFDLSIDGYYKDMNNLIEYTDGASFAGSSSGWEDKVEAGIGRSYGVEIALERHVGATTGTLSYAWSKSERRFAEINYGEWFPAKFDRRHSVNATVTHKPNKKIDLTASWTFASGDMMSLPLMSIDIANITTGRGYGDLYQLDHRNNYRMPAHHRLDVGMNFYPRKERNPQRYGVWNFSIYNVYNRMNAFKLYVQGEADGTVKLKKMVMFPILPSVSYTYNF